ncbi:hypothetical protein H4582DRAFT_2072490 [Lactarius indigo]|nr:hypothetical protein H4582DRAFT_2072490 [Lactarius indigo]
MVQLPLPSGATIDNTIGAVVVGWGISSLIFGMLCIQVWTYYQRSFALWALEVLHQIFVGHIAWFYVVENFGITAVSGLKLLSQPPVWTLSSQTLLGSLVGTIVKICFGMRVWRFSRGNYLVTGLIIGMAVAQFGRSLSVLRMVLIILTNNFGHIKPPLSSIGSAALALGVATDVFTAASLSYFLHKMRTGFKRSDTLINRLIIYSVNTGALTSVFSAAVLASYNLMPSNLIYVALYFVLTKRTPSILKSTGPIDPLSPGVVFANSCSTPDGLFMGGVLTTRRQPIPTFLMVANTLPAPPERTLAKRNVRQQRGSIVSESDKVPQYAHGW